MIDMSPPGMVGARENILKDVAHYGMRYMMWYLRIRIRPQASLALTGVGGVRLVGEK